MQRLLSAAAPHPANETRFWLTIACATVLSWRFGTPVVLALHHAAAVIRQRPSPKPARKELEGDPALRRMAELVDGPPRYRPKDAR